MSSQPQTLAELIQLRLRWLKTHHYQPGTIKGQRYGFKGFLAWCEERELSRLEQFSPEILESYQRHLSYKQFKQHPLRARTQAHIISYLKSLFQWAYVQGFLLYDPSVGLVAPRVPDSLPQQP
ncbi:site-specific integrase, partial [Deltaproteobacteria bacterium TL4]